MMPSGIITQVDRDGNIIDAGIDDVIIDDARARHESSVQLTSVEGETKRQRKGWSMMRFLCRCFSPVVIEAPEGTYNHSGMQNGHMQASQYDYGMQDANLDEMSKMYNDSFLLPTKLVPFKVTLILDLDETLVHSSFKPVPGADWVVPVEIDGTVHRVFVCKRPGLDNFMRRVAKLFEVVVFTASLDKYANPVLDLLERSAPKSVHFRLFREHCVFTNGVLVKDLTRLGRDPRQVILVDNSPSSYMLQPENAIPISSWFDSQTDQQLPLLIPWLEKLAGEDDVLPTLQQLRQTIDSCNGNLLSNISAQVV
uniref:FCP1 homology domain-containing protein n=1 Tax=Hanusia phi TaxID=3032 RepID=A0A7S0HXH6_9CRYP|mmetsp:Transcript_5537/g.12867  ORF Transcript_5537/g.12867 Transcript_5537/m.12867 type:complete len:310 (+) Transcript_5537:497-1426(+)